MSQKESDGRVSYSAYRWMVDNHLKPITQRARIWPAWVLDEAIKVGGYGITQETRHHYEGKVKPETNG